MYSSIDAKPVLTLQGMDPDRSARTSPVFGKQFAERCFTPQNVARDTSKGTTEQIITLKGKLGAHNTVVVTPHKHAPHPLSSDVPDEPKDSIGGTASKEDFKVQPKVFKRSRGHVKHQLTVDSNACFIL